MKRSFSTLLAGLLVAGTASAATLTTTNLTIDVEDTGWSRDTGTFAAAGNNIWNATWFFYDGSTAAFADTSNFSAHTNDVVAGGTSSTATSLNSTGITFGSTTPIANLTATLDVTASDAGSAAEVEYVWNFTNSAGTPINLRVVWFVDGDISIGDAAYATNRAGFSDQNIGSYTLKNSKGVIGVGDEGTTGVDLAEGVLMDAATDPTYLFGLQSGGPSFYWSNGGVYVGNGIEVANEIVPAYQDVVEGDVNVDYFTDADGDSGGAMQFDIVVPASGSIALTTYLTFGLSEELLPGTFNVVSDVSDWDLYQ